MRTLFTKVTVISLMTFALFFVAGCHKEERTGGGSADDDWVDLGLPSGLLWATRNVGATSPGDYGDYFVWGETTPKSSSEWSNYRYCHGGPLQLTKYCSNSPYGYNGFTDNLTILQPGDDAATANYGGRTPTLVEWQEMMDNTTSQWTTQNGVNGRKFTSKLNGSSIFLPAAGGRWYKKNNAGGSGDYWTSTHSSSLSSTVNFLKFDSDGTHWNAGYRYVGRTVRPVSKN